MSREQAAALAKAQQMERREELIAEFRGGLGTLSRQITAKAEAIWNGEVPKFIEAANRDLNPELNFRFSWYLGEDTVQIPALEDGALLSKTKGLVDSTSKSGGKGLATQLGNAISEAVPGLSTEALELSKFTGPGTDAKSGTYLEMGKNYSAPTLVLNVEHPVKGLHLATQIARSAVRDGFQVEFTPKVVDRGGAGSFSDGPASTQWYLEIDMSIRWGEKAEKGGQNAPA